MQLNMEQKKLIQSMVMGQSMVKGVAGSGKTTVAVHRVSFYCIIIALLLRIKFLWSPLIKA